VETLTKSMDVVQLWTSLGYLPGPALHGFVRCEVGTASPVDQLTRIEVGQVFSELGKLSALHPSPFCT
jgi:hypothetical protein